MRLPEQQSFAAQMAKESLGIHSLKLQSLLNALVLEIVLDTRPR